MTVVIVQVYKRMLLAGHPADVVQQRLSVDLQCSPNHPAVVRFVENLSQPSLPDDVLSEVRRLAESKYERMRQRFSEGKVQLMGMYDHYAAQRASQHGDTPLHTPTVDLPQIDPSLPFQEQGVDQADEIVGDQSNPQQSSNLTPAQRRALELKSEARISAVEYYQKLFTETTSNVNRTSTSSSSSSSSSIEADENDNAPLAISTNVVGTNAVVAAFNDAPEPDIIESFAPFIHPMNGNSIGAMCILGDRMYTFANVLPQQQCVGLIQALDFSVDEEAFQATALQTLRDAGSQVMRTSLRRKFVHRELASIVWEAIKHHMPATMDDGRPLAGVRTRMNFYRYEEGQYFDTHLDGGHQAPTGETSEYTFVLYLNDGFTGGSTQFCDVSDWGAGQVRQINARQGSVLVFRQRDMKHRGATLLQGVKYIVQGMVMYRSVRFNTLGSPIAKPPMVFQSATCEC